MWGERERGVTNYQLAKVYLWSKCQVTVHMECIAKQCQSAVCKRELHHIGWYTAIQYTMETVVQTKQLLWLTIGHASLNIGRLVMRGLYLSHLVDIADGSRHALAIKQQNLCRLLRSAISS